MESLGLKILITGYLGYVGSAVVKEIRKQFPEATLIGFDTGYFGTSITGIKLPELYLDEQYFGDIRSFPSILLDGVDMVVHLAAISNDPIGKLFEATTWDINCKSSCELAHKAATAGVKRFVFASSCSVYGFAENDSFLHEDSTKNPLTSYAKSKLKTEEFLTEYSKDTDMKIICLRFATACGMSDRLRLDLVVNDFVASAITKGKINILSDGKPWRPVICIKDMGKAICWGLKRNDDNHFIIVNAGYDQDNYNVLELAELVKQQTYDRYKTEIILNKNAQPDKRSYRVNFGKFTAMSGFDMASTSINDTIRELVIGIENLNLTPNYSNGNLIRLNQIENLREIGFLDKDLYWKR